MSKRFVTIEQQHFQLIFDTQLWPWMSEAYAAGYNTGDLLSNPYPDGSIEARRFVDGWVDGRKWKK